MSKINGLGRGLDALLAGPNKPHTVSTDSLGEMRVDALKPGKYQPRTRMDEVSLSELADSIRAQGIMQAILVRPVGNGKHEIIAGERRWRAAQMAGLTTVPVQIREVPDQAAAAMALIENIQREDLNPLEEAQGIRRLIEDFKLTHEDAAQAVGRSRSAVTNLLRLNHLAAPVQEMLMAGDIEMGHARALLSASTAQQVMLAEEASAKRLSVREVEKRVHALSKPAAVTRKASQDSDVRRLAEDLSEILGATVSIDSRRGGSGTLKIDYASLEQLDDIIIRLKPAN